MNLDFFRGNSRARDAQDGLSLLQEWQFQQKNLQSQ
jgi:hypothetical protein